MTTKLIKALLVLAARRPRARSEPPAASGESGAQAGGTLKVLDTAGGVDSLDPGYWYYQSDYQELGNTTQR